tara:strand:+ start:1513 stop:2289 length:777 start_codon:yes stop_codon:yes gene_type:complete
MPFIGTTPAQGFASVFNKQTFTANGSTTSFTLNHRVNNANDLEVFVGNVRQEPTEAYSASALNLTMTEAPANGVSFYVIYKGLAQVTTSPSDGSVGVAQLQNNSVDLTSKVTGVLPVAKGGTGISSDLGLIIKRTVITSPADSYTIHTSSYQTMGTFSFTPQASTVSMLVFYKTTVSQRAGSRHFHRIKYDGDILMTTDTYDSGVNSMYTSNSQDVMMSTITLPKSGSRNFTYEGAGNSNPATAMGYNQTLTIVELGV